MVRLRTIQIHGIRVPHRHVKCPHRPARAAVKGNEPAVDAGYARRVLEGLAGQRLGRLRDSVVARGELELDHVAWLGGHAVGREGEGIPADHDGDEARGVVEVVGGDWFAGRSRLC